MTIENSQSSFVQFDGFAPVDKLKPPTQIAFIVTSELPAGKGSGRALGVETLALYLKKVDVNNALKISFLDLQYAELNDPMAQVRSVADDPHNDIIGISVRYNTYQQMRQTIDTIRHSPRFQTEDRPLVLIGGVMPSFLAKETVEQYPEVVVISGEAELAVREAVKVRRNGGSRYEIPGATFFDEEKQEIVQTKPSNLPLEITSDGRIIEDLIPQLKAKGGIVWISSSRGCPWNCSFCTVSTFREFTGAKGKIRREIRPVADVIDELRALYSQGLKHFVFGDDEMLVKDPKDLSRWRELADGIKSIGNDITYQCSVRSDVIYNKKDTDGGKEREEALRALFEAGMTHAYVGFESGSPTQLKRYNKAETVEDHLMAITRLRQIGILVGGGFIMFDPLMKPEEILENIKFLRDADLISLNRKDYVGDIFDMLRAQRDSSYVAELKDRGLLREPIPDTLFYNYEFEDPDVKEVAETCISLAAETDVFFETLKNAVFAKTMQDERTGNENYDTILLNRILINLRLLDMNLLEKLTNQVLENKGHQEPESKTFDSLVTTYRKERKDIIASLVDEIRRGNVEQDAGEVLLSHILDLPDFEEEKQRDSIVIDDSPPSVTV